MKIIIVGYGVQGKKRRLNIDNKSSIIAIVDPYYKLSDYNYIQDVPINTYNTVFICTPDSNKEEIINYCVEHNKNILVEKPLIFNSLKKLNNLEKKINKKKITLYTAYNHRFEPHIKTLKKIIKSKKFGKIYYCSLFYGNGTAKLVKKSNWRDQRSGVFGDLAPHLIDMCYFLFGINNVNSFKLVSSNNYENKAPDHVIIKNYNSKIKIFLEMTLCMWKNDFRCDLICEKGSIHINSLCKWGPTTIITRKRKLPSGKPSENKKTIISSDPTWFEEYKFFRKASKRRESYDSLKDISILKNILNIENEIKKK